MTQKDVQELLRLYEVRSHSSVLSFLSQNRNLVPVVVEGAKKVRKYFGENVRLVLEVDYDPEEDWEEMFVYIVVDESSDAISNLERFDNEWFLDVLDQTGNLFNFNLLYS